MATPAEVIAMVSSLMNDTAQTVYTESAVLPYFNMALNDLEETFEQYNVSTTNEVSDIITVPAGNNSVAFRKYPSDQTDDNLPADLVEIRRLWESPAGEDNWTPMMRKEYISHYLEHTTTNKLLYWEWLGGEIHFLPANVDIDLKIDYIKKVMTPISMADMQTDIPIRGIKSYLGYRTASLCAMYIGENAERAQALASDAEVALMRLLGVNTKGRQAINTRRRPFRAGWKRGAYF